MNKNQLEMKNGISEVQCDKHTKKIKSRVDKVRDRVSNLGDKMEKTPSQTSGQDGDVVRHTVPPCTTKRTRTI